MTAYERVKMLLRREIPDMMGIYEHFWPETLRDYWTKEGYPNKMKQESKNKKEKLLMVDWSVNDGYTWQNSGR